MALTAMDRQWADEMTALRIVRDYIFDAMTPFKPVGMHLYSQYNLDYNQYKMVVDIRNTGHRYELVVDEIKTADMIGVEDLAHYLGQMAWPYFRNLRPEEPGDNIELGEN